MRCLEKSGGNEVGGCKRKQEMKCERTTGTIPFFCLFGFESMPSVIVDSRILMLSDGDKVV